MPHLIREVQGLFAPSYLAADEAQLFYELKRTQTLPRACGGHRIYSTNVQDIVLLRLDEYEEVNMIKIHPGDVSYAAELRSLSMFLRFKLDEIEGRKKLSRCSCVRLV